LVDNVFQLFLNGFIGDLPVKELNSKTKSEFLSVWREPRPGGMSLR
jgi:hypothetical protein